MIESASNSPAPSSPSASQFDVDAQRVGAVYAKAFLGAATAAGKTEELLVEFESFLDDVLAVFPEFARILSSGIVTHEERVGILDRVLAKQASPLLLNFLKVVSSHDRLEEIEAIGRIARKMYNESQGFVRVEVQTASPLDQELSDSITKRLQSLLSAQPEIVLIRRPELIGGLVVRVGDTVFDGSVSTQLERARSQMINRSIHEIQSRRDRFRHSGGD